MAVGYASSKGVPLASFLVPFSGVIAIIGGLLIVLGYKAKLGAWVIVAFLIPVTVTMHAFWKETDPNQMQMQISNFLKNISMLGGAFLITWFGAGPLSFDNRNKAG
jgi:putative oxidoreductase